MKNTRLVTRWAALFSVAALFTQSNFSTRAATVADWTFEEGVAGAAVTNVADYSGNGHNGSIVWGSPTYVQSGPGSQGNVSMSFPPGTSTSGSGFQPADSPAFNIQTFTLEVSFTPGPSSPEWAPWGGYLIGGFVPNGGAVYGIGYHGDSHVATFGPLSGPIPLDDRSHNVAVVYVNRTATLYIDGQSVGTTNLDLSPSFPAPGSPMRVCVGSNYNRYYWINATLDRVRISDQALSPQQFFFYPSATSPMTVADWTFEEGVAGAAVTNVVDYSGNGHNGSIVWGLPTYVQSGQGTSGSISINLPQSSGFRPLDSPAFNLPNQFTLEIQFRPETNNTGWRYLIGDFIPNGAVVLGLGYRSDPSEVGMATLVGPQAVPVPLDGRSHHVAAVYSNQTLTLYLDGQARSSTNIDIGPTFALPGSPMRLCVGSDYNGGFAFNGVADRVRISNQALSPQQFFNSASTTTGCTPPTGIAGWWPGEGNANDVIGTNNGTVQGNVTYTAGVVGEAFEFDGSAINRSCVVLPGASLANNTNLSLEAWVKPLSQVTDPVGQALIFGQAFGPQLLLVPAGANTVKVKVAFQAADGSYPEVESLSELPIGTFSHVAGTWDGATLSLYVDGRLDNQSRPGEFPIYSTAPFFIGGFNATYQGVTYVGEFLDGAVDESSVYRRALTSSEIQTIYALGSAGKCAFGGEPGSGCTPPPDLVGWWPGQGNANDIVRGNNGTVQGNVTYTAGEVGEAFQFDGSSVNRSCVVIPGASLANNTKVSVEAWVKPLGQITDPTGQAFILGQNFGIPQLVLVSTGPTTMKAKMQFQATDGSYPFVESASDIPIGLFTHLFGTWDGTTLRVYVNGQLDNEAIPGKRSAYSTNPFFIGGIDMNYLGQFYVGQFFNGVIDEASLYWRALAPAEIQTIYSLGSAGKCLSGGTVGDGIPDAWRLKYFGTNFVNNPQATANADPDRDGADNYQEYLAGTDPLNSNSVPVLPAIVSTYAGAAGGYQDGYRTTARFDGSITDLKYDHLGRIWLLESSVSGDMQRPDTGGQRIRILDTNGVVTTLTGSTNGWADGPLSQALFSIPNGLAFDSAGNAFIADQGNNRIRKIGTNGVVSTFAGSTAGYRDGVGTNAQFNAPSGLAIDANDNVYVADSLNQRIRIITPDGLVSTFSGSYGTPIDIAIAKNGTLFIADSSVGAIREISTNGVVSTFATGVPYLEHLALDATGGVYAATSLGTLLKLNPDGTTAWSVGDGLGYRDGLAALAKFVQLGRPLALPDGSLIVGDYYHIRQITFGIPPLVLINPGGGLFTNSIAVTLETSVAGGVIRYTLDGTTPGTNAAVYTPDPTNSLTLSNSTALTITLQAVVFVNNYPVSQVASATFTNAFNAWLAQYFGPNFATNAQATATADPDADGSNNYQEFLDGTNPLDPKSVKIHVTARIVPLIVWNSVSNQAYRVYRKDDPNSTNVTVVAPSLVATNATTSYIDLNPDLKAYYWIELLTNAP